MGFIGFLATALGDFFFASREATDPMEAEVPLMAPFSPCGKKPPLPLALPRTAMLITCKSNYVVFVYMEHPSALVKAKR